MNSYEKADLLKETITQLYSQEGRSRSYIGRLLGIDRKIISAKIKEWNLPDPQPKRHAKPSTQKFINRNRLKIKSMLDRNYTIADIAKELGVTRDVVKSVFVYDEVLKKAEEDRLNRIHQHSQDRLQKITNESSRNYDITNLDNEEWKTILGFEKYMVSNMGRIKAYAKKYRKWYLITPTPNVRNGRLYIRLSNGREQKNLQLSRIVAHAFVRGFSPERNTVNHKNGNVSDCRAENLEWMSQSENNSHSYRELKRQATNSKRFHFEKIIYDGKYEFKTIAALARFLNLSETQTRRYLEEPEKHNLQLIHNCND